MGTSTVLSAMEWQQPSRLSTTSPEDICMPACKMHKHQRVSSGLSPLIKRAYGGMSMLWQEEEFEQICSRKLLTEKAADIEKTISVEEHNRERYDFDRKVNFYQKSKDFSQRFTAPGRISHALCADMGHSACRSWRHRCSTMLIRQDNLFMSHGCTFLIRLLPPSNNRV